MDVGASPHIHLIKPLGHHEDNLLLVNLRVEANCLPGRVWECIFHADLTDARREPNAGDRATVFAIPGPRAQPTLGEDTSPTHKLLHLEAFTQEVINLLTPHLKVQMRLIRSYYVRVQVKERQFCPRDTALALGTARVQATILLSAINMHIPIDDNVGRVVLSFHEGVPNRWLTALLAMRLGDFWLPHNGRIQQERWVPANIVPGDAHIIAFAALGTHWAALGTRGPYRPPPPTWAPSNPS